MSERIPDCWQRRSLSSLGEYHNGFAFNDSHWSEHGLPIVRIAQITGTQGVVDRYPGILPNSCRIDSGDLVFSWSGTLTVVRWRNGPAWLNQHLFKVVPAVDVDSSLLYHLLQSSVVEMNKRTHGSTMKHIKRGELQEFFVTLPVDLNEQRQLAQILDTLDTAIQETEAIIAKLKAVKQGLLHDLLTRGIDANGELRPAQAEAPELYKMSALGWIPREWESHTLGTLADISGGVTLGRSIAGLGVVELPYLRVANVQDGYLDLTEIKKVRVLSSEVPRYKLEPGDVLMNEGGDFDKLGRGVIWSGELELCLHQNHVFRVRCDQVKLDSRYLAAYSASRFGKSYFVQASKQTTNLASINSTQLKAFPLMLPPPEEQHAIVEKLAGPDLRIESESLTRQKLLAQKSGLMDDLLTGRVRVTALLPDPAHAEESP